MKDYSDILNRKKTSDKLGDAFTDQANSMRPMNVGQRREQALLRGLGVGLNSDDDREAKLAELENMSKELAMNKYALEMQSGKNAKIKADNDNFFLSNRNDLATLNDFLQKGDFEAVNVMAPTLLENYKKITGKDIGEYSYSANGKIYMEDKQGNVKGQYIADILQGIIPEEEQMNFPELLTYNSKAAVANKLEEQRLKNDQIRAAIEASRAAIEASRASAELHRSQGYKSRNEMGEIEKLNYKNQLDKNSDEYKTKLKVNNDYIEGLSKENTRANNIIPILDEFNKLLTDSPELFGSGKWMEAKRDIAKFTGDDGPIQRANYLQKYFFPEIKGIAGNPNQREWGDLVGKIISESQNVEAAKAQIQLDKEILAKKQREFNVYTDTLGAMGHDKFYYDPEIKSRVSRKIKILEETEGKIKMKDSSGKIYYIPQEEKNKAIEEGLSIYE